MEIKFYDNEICIIAKDIEEVGELNNFFNKTNRSSSGLAFESKSLVRRSDNHWGLEVSISFNE
ncbi:MAG TPA: hypothetical protein VEI96_04055 [Thermodesulfovibrionales bacterium]|nr:hypothetical protein [Thermodesulfovibrionales bacterium]